MKKILLITILIGCFFVSKSQTYPITSNIGGPTTKTTIPNYGAINGGIIPLSFSDTTAASLALTYMKNYGGALIYTTDCGCLWFRYIAGTAWVQILPSGGSGGLQSWLTSGNLNVVADGSGNASFGTRSNNGYYFLSNNITRLLLDKTGILDNSSASVKYLAVDTANGRKLVYAPTPTGTTYYNTNLGSGYRLVVPNTNGIKTLRAGTGITLDSSTSNQITITNSSPGSSVTWQQSLINSSTLNQDNIIGGGNHAFTWNNMSTWLVNSNDDIALTSTQSGIANIFSAATGGVEMTSTSAGAGSGVIVTTDSISFMPNTGRMSIDTLALASSATNKQVMTWDNVTKRWEQIPQSSIASGTTLQQAINNGSTLNQFNTIHGGGQILLFDENNIVNITARNAGAQTNTTKFAALSLDSLGTTELSTQGINTYGGGLVSLHATDVQTAHETYIRAYGDSVWLAPSQGIATIDTLALASSTTNANVMVWNTVTKRWEQTPQSSIVGAVATLQQVTDKGRDVVLPGDSSHFYKFANSSGNNSWTELTNIDDGTMDLRFYNDSILTAFIDNAGSSAFHEISVNTLSIRKNPLISSPIPSGQILADNLTINRTLQLPDASGTIALVGGVGTVTSVSGTANQIGVATGTTTPVISLISGGTLPGNWTLNSSTATTQTAGDNSTKVATTAYVNNAAITLANGSGTTINGTNKIDLGGTLTYTDIIFGNSLYGTGFSNHTSFQVSDSAGDNRIDMASTLSGTQRLQLLSGKKQGRQSFITIKPDTLQLQPSLGNLYIDSLNNSASQYVLHWNKTTGAVTYADSVAGGGITGSGTTNTMTKFTGSTAVGNSGIADNGSTISTTENMNFGASNYLTFGSGGSGAGIKRGGSQYIQIIQDDGSTAGDLRMRNFETSGSYGSIGNNVIFYANAGNGILRLADYSAGTEFTKLGFGSFDASHPEFLISGANLKVMDGSGGSATYLGIGVTPTSQLHTTSFATAYIAKTGTYTATASDYTITGDASGGNFQITLPTAVGVTGRIYIIKTISTGTVTIGCTGGQNIDGSATKSLNVQYTGYTLQSNGSNWLIIGSF